jgi:phosphoribosyl-ATP pyrophosphohydrolase
MTSFSLRDLDALLTTRLALPDSETSYTSQLVAKGPAYAARKMGEEAIELVVAATQADAEAVILEAADLLYHLLVVLKVSQVELDAVMAELQRRTAQSGLAEKASRGTS